MRLVVLAASVLSAAPGRRRGQQQRVVREHARDGTGGPRGQDPGQLDLEAAGQGARGSSSRGGRILLREGRRRRRLQHEEAASSHGSPSERPRAVLKPERKRERRRIARRRRFSSSSPLFLLLRASRRLESAVAPHARACASSAFSYRRGLATEAVGSSERHGQAGRQPHAQQSTDPHRQDRARRARQEGPC